MDAQQLLFSLIRIVICEEKPDSALQNACTPEMLEQVCKLAMRHDLAHLVGQAAGQLTLPECEALTAAKQAAFSAAIRDVRRSHDYGLVCETLEEAGCPFLPLKGSVLCHYYPQPWLRTSCDIDILVPESRLESVTQLLIQKLSYRYNKKTSHDVSLTSPGGVCLELHYSLIEDSVSSASKAIVDTVWDVATPVAGCRYHMQMPDALFYYYHMAHMAKHFINGGCGIRTVLDTWVLNNRMPHDRSLRSQLLKRGELTAFSQAVEKLSRIWFAGEAPDPLSGEVERYILSGGTYGTVKNRVTINQQKKGGRIRYALSRIFLPYDIIKYHYPVLMKHKVLLPVFQVARWFKLLFRGGVRRSVDELQKTADVSGEERETAQILLEYLDLQS